MIDGGWAIPEARKALEEALAAIGRDLGDISHILVTHIHRDHYTQAVELRRLLGSRVYLGAGERPGPGDARPAAQRRPGRLAARPCAAAGRAELADQIAGDGPRRLRPERVGGPRPVARRRKRSASATASCASSRPPDTPRATWSSWTKQRGLLFAGDHVLPHITPSIGFELAEPAALPLADYLRLAAADDRGTPTPGCCPRTGRSPTAPTPASPNCSPTTTTGWPRA